MEKLNIYLGLKIETLRDYIGWFYANNLINFKFKTNFFLYILI